MKIRSFNPTIREVAEGYVDEKEGGVVGYDGKLDIRPKYQREFVYNDNQRDAVVKTVKKGFPLNTMYWVKTGDDSYEVLDGQQRTISICQFINEPISVEFIEGMPQSFDSLTEDEKNKILDYKLNVYICEGTDKERLEWFETINIAGVVLTRQELLNANYTGPWLSSAKAIFSKNNGAAYNLASKYIKGEYNRQAFLERAIQWTNDGDVADYMVKHQNNPNANELWLYFQAVIAWIEATFITYYPEMKGIDWGKLYKNHKDDQINASELDKEIASLWGDEEVQNKRGIFEYVLSSKDKNDSKFLSLRVFPENIKKAKYTEHAGICVHCGKHFEYSEMEGDHINPWSKGGKTVVENCQMLCKRCNATKGGNW